mgnify:CR=1 FL=1
MSILYISKNAAKITIWLQKSPLIQPRTDRRKLIPAMTQRDAQLQSSIGYGLHGWGHGSVRDLPAKPTAPTAKTCLNANRRGVQGVHLLSRVRGRELRGRELRRRADGGGSKSKKGNESASSSFAISLDSMAKDLFDRYDVNNNGTIDRSELRRMLVTVDERALGVSVKLVEGSHRLFHGSLLLFGERRQHSAEGAAHVAFPV